MFFFFPREKIFSSRENFQFFAREVLKLPEKKSRKLPEKKKCSREKIAKICPRKKSGCPRKKCRNFPAKIQRIPEFLPEKNNIQPEKNFEILPEKTSECPRKFRKKWARKIFLPEKKPKKIQKNGFSGTFHFLGKKKKH